MRFFLISFFIMVPFISFSNNISVSEVSLTGKNIESDYAYINCNISWENSWRVSNAPGNWDAAWVFAKFRVNNGEWQHVTLSTVDGEHNSPSFAQIDASDNGTGVFIFRKENGSGTFLAENVELRWEYGENAISDDEAGIEIKVFAIEMVYVPEGSFYIGDSGNTDAKLWDNALGNTEPGYVSTEPITVRCNPETTLPDEGDFDDDQLLTSGIIVDGDQGISTDNNTTINNANFPTGYNAFYCMKHEITNEQYVAFLNTLTREEQNNRTRLNISGSSVVSFPMTRSGNVIFRNSITYHNPNNSITEPVTFYCDGNNNGVENEDDDGQNVALCLLGWSGGAAYADWAGLRPMSELEFIKACRGPEVPVANGFAWGNSSIANSELVLDYSNMNNEYPQNPSVATAGNAAWAYTVGHSTDTDSPLRVGIFATATSDRITAGASYYGILDMTGGVAERCVTIGVVEGRNFQGTHGDGMLTNGSVIVGNATNADWPGIDQASPNDGVETRVGSGTRGGDWNDYTSWVWVSDRSTAAKDPWWTVQPTYHPKYGHPGSGFRCVRSE